MPYIKRELRPMFDTIFIQATYIDKLPQHTEGYIIRMLFNALNEVDIHKQTGCLNYFFTKLLRAQLSDVNDTLSTISCSSHVKINLLTTATKVYFLTDISYENLERANGFIHRIRKEFIRRNWCNNDIIHILDDLEILIDREAEDFEDQKIRENGDVY